jgi:hypothetical protein
MSDQPFFYLSLDLPKSFSREDAEKIKDDVLDFLESKKHYGAKYDGKTGITIKITSVRVNHD